VIYDAFPNFCSGLPVFGAIGTTLVGDSMDTGPLSNAAGLAYVQATGILGGANPYTANKGRNLGTADTPGALWLYLLVTTSFTSGGGATVEIDLMQVTSASSVSITAGLAIVEPIVPPATPYSVLVAGVAYKVAIARRQLSQFLQLQVTTAVAATTGGSITAFIAPNLQDDALYQASWIIK
jgi:hypothetical protein